MEEGGEEEGRGLYTPLRYKVSAQYSQLWVERTSGGGDSRWSSAGKSTSASGEARVLDSQKSSE